MLLIITMLTDLLLLILFKIRMIIIRTIPEPRE